MQDILDNGIQQEDRTGVGTLSVFGRQMRFDLQHGMPLLTTKKLHVKSIIYELLWFLNGDTNIDSLNAQGVTIWDEWADAQGDLGPIYGHQWRSWRTPDGAMLDQIEQVITQIKTRPHSRRHIVSAWNVADLPDERYSPQDNVAQGKMALAPCHVLFQFYVATGRLSCQLYQRSSDHFLGNPYNIFSYALFTHMVAQQCDLAVGEFIWTGGDCHLYLNHLEQAKLQLTRCPYPLPQLRITRKPPDIFSYQYADFEILNYQAHPHIKAPIAI